MTEADKTAYTPVEVPAESIPGWEECYPGRLRCELDALQRAGIQPRVDPDALKNGQLVLSFDWPLASGPILQLKALYPDSFPHVRPQVLLISGLDPLPTRHCSPIEGDLCLLGRDTAQWMPRWTLYELLAEQLEKSLSGSDDEDPQGEPAEVWWNALGHPSSFCLIDSAWDLGNVREGTLDLCYAPIVQGMQKHRPRSLKLPAIRAYISAVRDKDKNTIHRWDGPLPPDLATSKSKLRVPWVRVDETIMPERDLAKQPERIWHEHPWLQKSKPQNVSRGLSIKPFMVVHPIELSFKEYGLGWIPFLVYGDAQAFSPKPSRKKHSKQLAITSLAVYRAGSGDLGHRVPAVKLFSEKRVLIVGVGAVGAPVAIELARNGCKVLHLIENDIVEPGNTVRWPLGAATWGQRKLEAVEDFVKTHYPGTCVEPHQFCLGQPGLTDDGRSENELLQTVIDEVDLVIDGSASHGVTALLAERCKAAGVPLISLSATPTLEGGAVVLHRRGGGCPNCLEHAWHNNEIDPPPGRGSEDGLTQPPGCAERTFVGAGYDLQELSLQAVRLAVEVLGEVQVEPSVIQTLSFIDAAGQRCPPSWRTEPLPKHPECRCEE